MLNLSRRLAFLVVTFAAANAFAEDPPIAPSVDLLQPMAASPKMLPLLVRGADQKVVKKLEMVLFSDESGGKAVFKVKPKFEGCDFGLTLNF